VRNDKGGRCQALGGVRPKAAGSFGSRQLGEDSQSLDGGRAIFGQPQERQSGWAGWKATSTSVSGVEKRARKDGTHRFESPKEARRTGRLRRYRKMLDATGLGKPRGHGATVPRSRRHVGKTNDPHLVLMMARSRCFGSDGGPATLESPRTSWEAAKGLRT
jgi:hypothetical protein